VRILTDLASPRGCGAGSGLATRAGEQVDASEPWTELRAGREVTRVKQRRGWPPSSLSRATKNTCRTPAEPGASNTRKRPPQDTPSRALCGCRPEPDRTLRLSRFHHPPSTPTVHTEESFLGTFENSVRDWWLSSANLCTN